MADTNEELILKTLKTSDFFAGGQLNPEQQDRFLKYVKDYSVLLKNVRVERMTQPKADVDKLFVGETITESVEEDDPTPDSAFVRPKFGRVSLDVKTLRSAWANTTKSLQANIEQERLEDSLVEVYMKRIGTDLEDLFWNGDTTLPATTPRNKLLKRLDGISKLTAAAHVIDAGGASITKGLWSAALRAMPKQFASDPGLRWLVSKGLQGDWRDIVSDRPTMVGDEALKGNDLAPQGIPWLVAPVIPDDLALTVAEATSAQVTGDRFDVFEIKTGVNDKFRVDIDNAGAVTVTFPQGVFHAIEIAAFINATPGLSGVASATREGQVVITSPTTGAASEVDIQVVALDSYTELGFTVGVTVGVNAGGGGDVSEGTEIVLCNPKNLIWAMLDGTRVYSEFNKGRDRVETVVYNQVDTKIENIDALVKIVNVRRRDLF
jgi:hypothetical protein